MVEKLMACGAAYVVDDPEYPDVYQRADATAQFGYESNYDRDTMMRLFAERGGDPDRPGKSDPLDAPAVAGAPAGEPSWSSPFGPGRPGLACRMFGDFPGAASVSDSMSRAAAAT